MPNTLEKDLTIFSITKQDLIFTFSFTILIYCYLSEPHVEMKNGQCPSPGSGTVAHVLAAQGPNQAPTPQPMCAAAHLLLGHQSGKEEALPGT